MGIRRRDIIAYRFNNCWHVSHIFGAEMTHSEFYKLFYSNRKSMVSEAARLVLVKDYTQAKACKCTGADKGTLHHFLRYLRD